MPLEKENFIENLGKLSPLYVQVERCCVNFLVKKFKVFYDLEKLEENKKSAYSAYLGKRSDKDFVNSFSTKSVIWVPYTCYLEEEDLSKCNLQLLSEEKKIKEERKFDVFCLDSLCVRESSLALDKFPELKCLVNQTPINEKFLKDKVRILLRKKVEIYQSNVKLDEILTYLSVKDISFDETLSQLFCALCQLNNIYKECEQYKCEKNKFCNSSRLFDLTVQYVTNMSFISEIIGQSYIYEYVDVLDMMYQLLDITKIIKFRIDESIEANKLYYSSILANLVKNRKFLLTKSKKVDSVIDVKNIFSRDVVSLAILSNKQEKSYCEKFIDFAFDDTCFSNEEYDNADKKLLDLWLNHWTLSGAVGFKSGIYVYKYFEEFMNINQSLAIVSLMLSRYMTHQNDLEKNEHSILKENFYYKLDTIKNNKYLLNKQAIHVLKYFLTMSLAFDLIKNKIENYRNMYNKNMEVFIC